MHFSQLTIARFTVRRRAFSRGIRAIYRRWSMRTSAPIDLSFRSVDLIPSEHLSRTKCIRLHAPMRIPRPSLSLGREKGREWEMHPDGTVSFTCMHEQFHGMIQLRVCASLHRHACSVMISGSRDASVSQGIDTLGRSKMKQYARDALVEEESFDEDKYKD